MTPAQPSMPRVTSALLLLALVLSGGQAAEAGAPTACQTQAGALVRARPDLWTTSEDLRVTRNIRNALEREVMDSDPVAIRIQTRKGAVILSGTIDSVAERSQVEAIVHQTPGAQTLSDQLRIR